MKRCDACGHEGLDVNSSIMFDLCPACEGQLRAEHVTFAEAQRRQRPRAEEVVPTKGLPLYATLETKNKHERQMAAASRAAHTPFAPSSAARWDVCPGKVLREEFIGAAPARDLDL